MRDKNFGWYSAAQAALYGTYIWRDTGGKEITVSEVTHTEEYTSKWKDVEFRGELQGFLRKGAEGASPLNVRLELRGMMWR